ncbi:MAG: DUF3309 domain-containing protein [Sneathiella sp.]|nr:DUF3309 domain-containing protein [Sneathiella sp.]
MAISSTLIFVLLLFLLVAYPSWPHSKNWGYWPTGTSGAAVVVLLIVDVVGRI